MEGKPKWGMHGAPPEESLFPILLPRSLLVSTSEIPLQSSAGTGRADALSVSSPGLRLHRVTFFKQNYFLSEKDSLDFLQSVLGLFLEAGTFPSLQTKAFVWGAFPSFFYSCGKITGFHAKTTILLLSSIPDLTFPLP